MAVKKKATKKVAKKRATKAKGWLYDWKEKKQETAVIAVEKALGTDNFFIMAFSPEGSGDDERGKSTRIVRNLNAMQLIRILKTLQEDVENHGGGQAKELFEALKGVFGGDTSIKRRSGSPEATLAEMLKRALTN